MQYRKIGLAAFIMGAVLLLFTTTVNAQEAPAEVTCSLGSDPTAGTYPLGTSFDLETTYDDPDGIVQTFIFSENGTAFEIGNAPFATWTPDSNGTYTISVELRDEGNNVLCSDSLNFTIADDEEEPPAEVTCYLNNNTNPDIRNVDGSYDLGTTLILEAHVTDPDLRVANIVFSAGQDNKGGTFQSGTDPSANWTPTGPGVWTVAAQLFDADDNLIESSGDCVNEYTIVAANSEPPVTSPPTTAPSVTTTPSTNGNTPPTSGVLGTTDTQNAETLPETGAATGWTALVGFLLVTTGVIMVRLSRKQKGSYASA